MNSTFRNTASIVVLVLLLMGSLYAISDATSQAATFSKYYNWLVFFNAIALVALLRSKTSSVGSPEGRSIESSRPLRWNGSPMLSHGASVSSRLDARSTPSVV